MEQAVGPVTFQRGVFILQGVKLEAKLNNTYTGIEQAVAELFDWSKCHYNIGKRQVFILLFTQKQLKINFNASFLWHQQMYL